jgi:hypothetical protein
MSSDGGSMEQPAEAVPAAAKAASLDPCLVGLPRRARAPAGAPGRRPKRVAGESCEEDESSDQHRGNSGQARRSGHDSSDDDDDDGDESAWQEELRAVAERRRAGRLELQRRARRQIAERTTQLTAPCTPLPVSTDEFAPKRVKSDDSPPESQQRSAQFTALSPHQQQALPASERQDDDQIITIDDDSGDMGPATIASASNDD